MRILKLTLKSSLMKMFIVIFSFFGVGLIFASCRTKNCTTLPEYFTSNDDAISRIKASDFEERDSINNVNADWLISANYYTCNGKTGYIIYRLKSGSESYNPEVPISVWREFKKSSAKESYYDENIQKKYPRKKLHILE